MTPRTGRDELQGDETQLRAIISGVRDYAISLLDPSGRIVTWNQAAESMKGYVLDEVRGKHIEMLFADEDRASGAPQHELDVARERGLWQGEGRRRRKDGTYFPASVSISALRDGNGTLTGFVKVTRDVTTRRREEDQLRTARHQLDVIVQGITDGLTAQDPNGRLLYANDAGARIMGFESAAALVATPVDQIMSRFTILTESGEPMPRDALVSMRARNGETPPEQVVRFRTSSSGEERWSIVRSVAAFDAEGRVEMVINFFRDVTERRRADEALRVSEARLNVTLHSIGDAVIATDASGRVTFMNPIAETMTGWRSSEARERPLADVFRIVDEQTRAAVPNPVEKILREGATVALTNHTALIARDGTERSIADSGAPIRDATGEAAGLVLVFRDVTDERRQHARDELLAKLTAELASTLDYEATLARLAKLVVPELADWCVIELVDANGKLAPLEVAHVDPEKSRWAWEVSRQYPPDPNAATGSAEVLRTGRAEFFPAIVDEMVAAMAKDAEHLRLLRGLGFTSYIGVPLAARGRVFGVLSLITAESRQRYNPADVAFAEEIARRAAMAIDNARLFREARDANQLKDDFLATVSHELRTPLAAILGWARILRQSTLDEERRAAAIATIERNAVAQTRLIDDLLDVSRIMSGKLRLALGSVDVGAVTDLAIESVRPAADAKGVHVAATGSREARSIVGDTDRLQQVIWNLLTNAVKFTPRGGHIDVVVRREHSALFITVSDDGVGIAPEFLPFVFDRFRQADSSHSRAHGGLGLGLAITRQIVQLHGGVISVASEGIGHGTKFTVTLPIAAVAPDRSAQDIIAAGGPNARPAPPMSLHGLRVLVVDDERDARDLLMSLLTSAGASVSTVASASEAFESVKASPPDVVVSDIGMPSEDGYSLIRRIRALSPTDGGRIPALALTAYARQDDRTRALIAGYNNYATKPIAADELLVVIASLCGRLQS